MLMLTPARRIYGSFAVLAVLAFGLSIKSVTAVEAVTFKAHPVGPQGNPIYQARIVDMNGDGLPDILPTIASFDGTSLSWYENPDWQQHLITTVPPPVGLWTAAQDLDGDGIPELGLAAGFTPLGVERASGELFLLQHQGTATAPWHERLFDRLTMSHRMEFIDIDGTDEIIIGNREDVFDTYVYYATDHTATSWQRRMLDDSMGGTDCNVADLNRDDRLDIVCSGHYSENLRWYETSATSPS